MASESAGEEAVREAGHQNHFRQLAQEGKSWSGREPNVLFQNRGDGTFDELGNALGVASILDSRGAATGDLDGDGDLDLVVYNRNNPILRIYRNDAPAQGKVLQLDLVGTDSGRDAFGAQAVLRCGEQAMLRQVEGGAGYLSQSSPTLHFGLGACENVDELTIRWPSGLEQRFEDLDPDQRLRIVEGEEALAASALGPRNANAGPVEASLGNVSAEAPEGELPFFEDAGGVDLSAAEGPLLINAWATWCTACIAEMPELEELSQEFGPRGVRFLGLVMDERDMEDEVRDFLEARGAGYEQVWGTPELANELASLAGAVPGAIPVTALVQDGLVRYVHAGAIDAEDMRERLERLIAEQDGA